MAESHQKPKQFYRSTTDKKVAGVCGGIAEYFNVDATLVRIATLILILLSGVLPGLVVYLIAAVIAPVR